MLQYLPETKLRDQNLRRLKIFAKHLKYFTYFFFERWEGKKYCRVLFHKLDTLLKNLHNEKLKKKKSLVISDSFNKYNV